jgi:hypothetical protein
VNLVYPSFNFFFQFQPSRPNSKLNPNGKSEIFKIPFLFFKKKKKLKKCDPVCDPQTLFF